MPQPAHENGHNPSPFRKSQALKRAERLAIIATPSNEHWWRALLTEETRKRLEGTNA